MRQDFLQCLEEHLPFQQLPVLASCHRSSQPHGHSAPAVPPGSQVGAFRHSQVRQLIQGLLVRKGSSWPLNPDCLTPNPSSSGLQTPPNSERPLICKILAR